MTFNYNGPVSGLWRQTCVGIRKQITLTIFHTVNYRLSFIDRNPALHGVQDNIRAAINQSIKTKETE